MKRARSSRKAKPARKPKPAKSRRDEWATRHAPALRDLRPRTTPSGLPIEPVYDASDVPPEARGGLPLPGDPPYARGIHPGMYRARLWTMRQYAGFGTAHQTNERFRYLLAQGQTGLSVAFDLPTQMGLDSDHARARGEVGKVGVAISCLKDMEALLAGIPLEQVTTSMTINATAAILLALYVAVADGRGTPRDALGGTVQNDVLKEYAARGTYIFPPEPSVRITTDILEFCARELPQWNSISVSGYHMREAGCTAVQELAFTLGNGLAYLEAARRRTLDLARIAARMSFFFNAHNHLLEEVAKFRAARALWAELLRQRFGITDPNALKLRFHTQTAGSMLTAQQPLNNVVRVTMQGLAAVLGGTQSLHTNAFDEALGLPGEEGALLALRTQQILANESGVTDTADPLAGAYVVEAMTSSLAARARDLVATVDAQGGMLEAIRSGWVQHQIHEAAYQWHRQVESGERRVVGVNAYVQGNAPEAPPFAPDPSVERERAAMLAAWRAARSAPAVEKTRAALRAAATGRDNLVARMIDAVKAGVTLGEISDTLREAYGVHQPARTL